MYFLALQILGRDDLCVESEGVLLDLVLRWAEDKVREFLSSCGWCLSEVAVEFEKEVFLLKLQPDSAIQQWRSTLASQEEGQGRDPRRERQLPGLITKIRARWTILFSPPVLWKGRPALCRTLPHASHSGGEEVPSERPHSAKGS